ncbi:hypothetical protein BJ741DRAFT_581347 [Chytriomyces cf. hyalinus JEL632]|nr:hypothetical protein BJ741DRAFT_581347 [Chytriomyces cf. hyalinus JEL632]
MESAWKVVADKLQLELDGYQRTMTGLDGNAKKNYKYCLSVEENSRPATVGQVYTTWTQRHLPADWHRDWRRAISVVAAGVSYLSYQGHTASVITHAERMQLEEGELLGLDYLEFTAETAVWAEVSNAITETSNNCGNCHKKFKKPCSRQKLTIFSNVSNTIDRSKEAFKNYELTFPSRASASKNRLTFRVKSLLTKVKSDKSQTQWIKIITKKQQLAYLMNQPERQDVNTFGVEVFFSHQRWFNKTVPLDQAAMAVAAGFCDRIYGLLNADDEISRADMLQGKYATIFKSHYIAEKNILFFVAICDSVAHVVCRGTEPLCVRNWGTSFSVNKEMLEECSFHSRYLDIGLEAIEMIRADVSKCKTVIFSGHSLGGAMAHTLHAVYLLTEKTDQFLEKHNMGRRFTTVVNKGDPVPLAFRALEPAVGAAKSKGANTPLNPEQKAVMSLVGDVANLIVQTVDLHRYEGTYIFFERIESERSRLSGGDNSRARQSL